MFILVDESNFFKSIYRPRMFKAIVNKMPKYKDIKNNVTLIVEEEIRTINVISKDSDDNSEGMAILTSDCLEGEQGISFDWIKPFSSRESESKAVELIIEEKSKIKVMLIPLINSGK